MNPLLVVAMCLATGLAGAGLGAWWIGRSLRVQLAAQDARRAHEARLLLDAIAALPSRWETPQVDVPVQRGRSIDPTVESPQPQPQPQPQLQQPMTAVKEVHPSSRAQAAVPPVSARTPVPARPPEIMRTPPPRPEPVHEPEAVERELTDEEIDALPPELPVDAKPRKRILTAAPKRPPFQQL